MIPPQRRLQAATLSAFADGQRVYSARPTRAETTPDLRLENVRKTLVGRRDSIVVLPAIRAVLCPVARARASFTEAHGIKTYQRASIPAHGRAQWPVREAAESQLHRLPDLDTPDLDLADATAATKAPAHAAG